ncbi:MAG TPA: helix-turn-helix domain-containing GNAT family N-acetyltransferase [Microvirga sp.]|jgi:DNA-binding MarR family transcriptional regulator/GNAT superfamily N-acetyltransferase|nr:helix-turn-helix domain-containing GNAT family N-acetyltransferase [Microvirga sp.]
MPIPENADPVDAVRRFTRFYTSRLGVLQEGLLDSGFSLTEARVLYELANRDRPTAKELAGDLELDPGYLSRILKRFEEHGLLERARSESDARQAHLVLTATGRAAYAPLNERSREQVARLLSHLSETDRRRLVGALSAAERLLQPDPPPRASYILRPHRPGDMGWIVHRHGALYGQEYGWDETFEALVAEIAASFIKDFDPKRERCWIAEKDGEIVGSVLLVKQSDEVAKLRLLYVEPRMRGHGIGKRFVEECIRFARSAGYRRLTLWTNDVLHAARSIYAAAGFRLVKAEPHRSFGHDLVGENWELEL